MDTLICGISPIGSWSLFGSLGLFLRNIYLVPRLCNFVSER